MSYMKLIKLMYLADREALLRWGRPISTDRYVSMDKGPVLSRVLDLATDGDDPSRPAIWSEQSRVRSCHCGQLLPSEPDVRVSPHPAQAFTKPRVSGAGFTTV